MIHKITVDESLVLVLVVRSTSFPEGSLLARLGWDLSSLLPVTRPPTTAV